MNRYDVARDRFYASMRRRPWTHRRWWLKAAAINIGLARITRKMGGPAAEIAELLGHARADRRLALRYDRRHRIKR